MCHKTTSAVYKHSKATGMTRFVLVAIADCKNSKTGRCFPSLTHLSNMVGCHRSTVVRAIEELEKIGELQVERQQNKSNRYFVTVGESSSCDTRLGSCDTQPQVGATRPPNQKINQKGTGTDHSGNGFFDSKKRSAFGIQRVRELVDPDKITQLAREHDVAEVRYVMALGLHCFNRRTIKRPDGQVQKKGIDNPIGCFRKFFEARQWGKHVTDDEYNEAVLLLRRNTDRKNEAALARIRSA